MIPQGDSFKVEYGRIGVGGFQSLVYPLSKWESTYRSKLKKGYEDQTRLIEDLVVKSPERKYTDISDPSVLDIVNRLQDMAKKTIAANYTVAATNVTNAMIDEAQGLLNELLQLSDITEFNSKLVDLFKVLPRRMKNVSDYLAQSTNDFDKIIAKEQDLLDVMKGQVVHANIFESNDMDVDIETQTILDAFGLVIESINDTDKTKIKYNLGNLSYKFHKAWQIKNIKTQKIFDDFVKQNGNLHTKLLWHGSRNENWWNIVNTGLILRPTNVVITGKMFGMGTYFATKAQKSFGYTSYSGSYWARGNAGNAFMGLYDVAYGKPYDVHSFENKLQTMTYEKLQKECAGANCLHAHADSMLRNDEIVVYKEDQTTIRYLVELK